MTTGALARRIGVSPTTLRSWDRRYGLGPAVRADGRHRRWSPGDVAMLEEMCRLTATGLPPAEAARAARERARSLPAAAQAPTGPDETPAPAVRPGRRSHAPSGLPLGDTRQECRGLARAAVRLDAPAVQDQLTALVREHGLTVAWEEVMVPTLRAVGRKWESSGDRYVEVEHLLSWHVSSTLRGAALRSAGTVVPAAVAPVVLACVPGEQHTLPLEALNAALAERGLATRMLGGAVPVEALVSAVRRVGPAAVVLWSQSPATAVTPLAQRLAATTWGVRGARRRPLVMTAGPGWARRAPGPGTVRPRGLRDAVAALVRACGGDEDRSAADAPTS
ncbi:MerR family transcriptional regulator [Streptomyces sp. NPDC051976]|uniref:MerR family transcriptional regulator n=1 Tax=Streptomyces sp. NPDC051976 TaxID=3154947 RepID=UPI003432DFD2